MVFVKPVGEYVPNNVLRGGYTDIKVEDAESIPAVSPQDLILVSAHVVTDLTSLGERIARMGAEHIVGKYRRAGIRAEIKRVSAGR